MLFTSSLEEVLEARICHRYHFICAYLWSHLKLIKVSSFLGGKRWNYGDAALPDNHSKSLSQALCALEPVKKTKYRCSYGQLMIKICYGVFDIKLSRQWACALASLHNGMKIIMLKLQLICIQLCYPVEQCNSHRAGVWDSLLFLLHTVDQLETVFCRQFSAIHLPDKPRAWFWFHLTI